MGDQHGFFQNIRWVQLEKARKVETQCVRDEERRLLLNVKSGILDPDIAKRPPQQPVASALGTEPTEEEIATAMKAMSNTKAVAPNGLPMELLKLGIQ